MTTPANRRLPRGNWWPIIIPAIPAYWKIVKPYIKKIRKRSKS